MGNYNSQYESYYNSLANRIDSRGSNYGKSKNNYFRKGRLFRTIKIQLTGTLILFTSVFICKLYVTPQTKAAYSFAKNIINENYDINSLIEYGSNINLSDIENYVQNANFNDIQNKFVNLIDTERAKVRQ
jgi:hypothetical protein